MLFHKGFHYRIYPTPEQAERLLAWEHSLRFLWNLALEQRLYCLAKLRDERVYLSAFDQINELTILRAELPWLAEVPRNVSNQLLVELDKAWQKCFKKLVGAPSFKSRDHGVLGLCEPHSEKWSVVGSVLSFPKLGNVRAVIHRPLEGRPKTCTIKRDGDQWFASIACEIERDAPTPRTEPVVALDRGAINLTGDSDGHLEPNPRFYTKAMKRLGRAQRGLARKQKGSKNYLKAKTRVMRINRKVRRQREHVIQTLSHSYAKSHGTVVLEDLDLPNMTKSAAGTVAKPGKNVAQKRGLNRSLLDAGLGRLGECLRYKLAWNGGQLAKVPAAYSSQTCSSCGHVDLANRQSQAVFCCVKCGLVEHADVNAACVLKDRYLKSRVIQSAQPVEGSAPKATLRSRKRLRVYRRAPKSSVPGTELSTPEPRTNRV